MSSLALNKSSNTNETESNDIISSYSFWDNLYSMDSNYLSFTDMVSDNNNFIIPMQNGDSEEIKGNGKSADGNEEKYKDYEEAISTSDKNPYGLHAQLSGHKAFHAREAMIDFFENNLRLVWIGNSSNDMRAHYLYRGEDGNLYNVHDSYGKMTAHYFTKNDLDWAFQENPEGKPDWKLSEEVDKEIKQMNPWIDEEHENSDTDSDTEDPPPSPIMISREVSEIIPKSKL